MSWITTGTQWHSASHVSKLSISDACHKTNLILSPPGIKDAVFIISLTEDMKAKQTPFDEYLPQDFVH
jgi:hypothetical protein